MLIFWSFGSLPSQSQVPDSLLRICSQGGFFTVFPAHFFCSALCHPHACAAVSASHSDQLLRTLHSTVPALYAHFFAAFAVCPVSSAPGACRARAGQTFPVASQHIRSYNVCSFFAVFAALPLSQKLQIPETLLRGIIQCTKRSCSAWLRVFSGTAQWVHNSAHDFMQCAMGFSLCLFPNVFGWRSNCVDQGAYRSDGGSVFVWASRW